MGTVSRTSPMLAALLCVQTLMVPSNAPLISTPCHTILLMIALQCALSSVCEQLPTSRLHTCYTAIGAAQDCAMASNSNSTLWRSCVHWTRNPRHEMPCLASCPRHGTCPKPPASQNEATWTCGVEFTALSSRATIILAVDTMR